jgi:hypothetical protein
MILFVDFWALIDEARGSTERGAPSVEPERLRAVLTRLANDEVVAFGVEYCSQLARLQRWEIWDAGFVAADGMSDDGFHYFRSWLIGKGRDAVEQALRDPEGLVPYLDDSDLDNELLEYVAIDILEEREAGVDPRLISEWIPDGNPEGVAVSEADLSARYPAIAAWGRDRRRG